MTDTEHDTTEVDAYDGHVDASGHRHGMTDMQYVGVFVLLSVLTAMEVTLTYMHLDGRLFLTFLLIVMVCKFVTVVSRFMHLKFDNKIFSWLFYTGVLLAVGVYCVALATFQFFRPS